jgi:Ca2+-binding RTX toxin-like protein
MAKNKTKQIGEAAKGLTSDTNTNSNYQTNPAELTPAIAPEQKWQGLQQSDYDWYLEAVALGHANGHKANEVHQNEGHQNEVRYLSTDAYNGFFIAYGGYGADWGGIVLGEQLVSGPLVIGSTSFNAQSIEFRQLTPEYTNPYTDDIFTNNWLTDYLQLIIKVTTDDGMKLVFTMNVMGIGAHIINVDYEVNTNKSPVGVLPDIGEPYLAEPTIEAAEALLGIQWTPTTTTNAAGIVEQHMIYNGTADANYVIVNKENAIVNLGGGHDYAVGSIHGDIINGDDGQETLFGFDGNDTLNGGADTDNIFGGQGNDILNGGSGDDFIYLYTYTNNYSTPTDFFFIEGSDTITGGSGADRFHFGDTDIYNTGKPIIFDGSISTITDFTSGEDKITFWSLQILTDNLVQGVNPIAQDANDYILFNTENKQLFIDLDGNGAGEAIHFATLVGVDSLTFNDFGY